MTQEIKRRLKQPSDWRAFWPAFWLAMALIGIKAYYLGLPKSISLQALLAYIKHLSAISYEDVLFVVVVGSVHQLLLVATSRQSPIMKTIDVFFLVFYGFSTIYSTANLQVFRYYQTPLTYPLLYLAGNFSNLRSSITGFLSVPILIGLVGIPVAYGLVVWKIRRPFHSTTRKVILTRRVAVLVALCGWIIIGQPIFHSTRQDHGDQKISKSAQFLFVSSFVNAMTSENAVRLTGQFSPQDLDDFKPIAKSSLGNPDKGSLQIYPNSLSNPKKPLNVILLVMESTAARWLSMYGSPYNATPNLAAEARHSLVFDNFYCHVGRTSKSLMAILLSSYPVLSWRSIAREFPHVSGISLAELVHERGYRTAFITSSDLQWDSQDVFLQGRGFDEIWDYRDLDCTPPFSSWGVEDRCMVDGIVKWIDSSAGRPFFIFGWTDQSHHPYEPTPGVPLIDFFQGNLPPDDYDLGRYLNVLHETDRHLGRLFTAIRERGLEDETLVVVTGDHGQAFGYPHDTFGHGSTLYEEDVRIPLMLWFPPAFSREHRSSTIGSLIDLNPTIADILGIPPAGSWQGRSLFSQAHPSRAYFFATGSDYILGVRDANWKYSVNATLGMAELYDLSNDPTEQKNVAPQRPDVCERLRSRVAAWVEANRQQYADLLRSVR